MKKQIVRIAALALFVTTFAVASAHAQNSGSNLRVTIPFDFMIGNKQLPAGDYDVRAHESQTMMKIQSLDRTNSAYFFISTVQSWILRTSRHSSFTSTETFTFFRKSGTQAAPAAEN